MIDRHPLCWYGRRMKKLPHLVKRSPVKKRDPIKRRFRRYLTVVIAAALAGGVFFVLFYSSMNRLVVITDPVWKRLALERGDYGLLGLRYAFLKSGFVLKVREIHEEDFDPESVYEAIDGEEGDVFLFSPGLSQFAPALEKRIYEAHSTGSVPALKRLITFSSACGGRDTDGRDTEGRDTGEGGVICISEDLSGACRRAGSRASEYVDKPAGKAQLFLVLTEASPRIDSYAEAFLEGWYERREGDEVRRIRLDSRDEAGEILREEGAGSGDFVWVGGTGKADEVLSRFNEWAVPSCVTGSNAAAAYPDTVKIEVGYEWEKALLAAASSAVSTDEGVFEKTAPSETPLEREEKGVETTVIKLEGELRSY